MGAAEEEWDAAVPAECRGGVFLRLLETGGMDLMGGGQWKEGGKRVCLMWEVGYERTSKTGSNFANSRTTVSLSPDSKGFPGVLGPIDLKWPV